jgi:hypothetical protein
MKYYTFYPEFHEAILTGVKTCTIREKAKVKPGEVFSLRYWTGRPYGSKQAELAQAVCLTVHAITIHKAGVWVNIVPGDGQAFKNIRDLAKMEGFKNPQSMLIHFARKHGLPFYGVATTWKLITGDPQ